MPAIATPLDLGQEFTHTWQEGVTTVTALWRADVERRQVPARLDVRDRRGLRGGHALADVARRRTAQQYGLAPGGQADIAAIHEVTRSFGELDNRFGSGRVRSSVVKYLDTAVTPLLQGRLLRRRPPAGSSPPRRPS